DVADLVFDLFEQCLDFGFAAGIDAVGTHGRALGCKLGDQRLRFRGIAPSDADMVAAKREAARHRRANGVAGANQDRNLRPIAHGLPPVSLLFELCENDRPGETCQHLSWRTRSGGDPAELTSSKIEPIVAISLDLDPARRP